MWRRTTTEYSGSFQRLGYGIIRTIVLVVRGFTSKNLNDTAKSLTYSLIFAVIPILAMVVAVAKGFGVSDVIEQQLNSSFLGETNMVPIWRQHKAAYSSVSVSSFSYGRCTRSSSP